jgi:soluble lytic murein transglycosylase
MHYHPPQPVKVCARFAFVIVFLLSLSSCTAQESAIVDFYEGLKKSQEEAKTEAITHFEKALRNANVYIATAAATELMDLYSTGTEIAAETMVIVQQKLNSETAEKVAGSATGSWIKALEMLDRDKTAAENAIINGSIAVSRTRYNEALLFFRMALHDSPELFFRYPDLISDLGRTFQYTATGTEGRDLFLKWEQTFTDSENADELDLAMHKAIPQDSEDLVRFRLLFFAARIARQRGHPHIGLFEQALPFAPNAPSEQSDACIWYILDSSLSQSPDIAIKHLEAYIPQWHDDAYFYDVIDKLSRELVLTRQWENMIKIFSLLHDNSGVIAAQYAWIIGRAIEEGLLSQNEINHAIAVAGGAATNDAANLYMRIAYDRATGTASNARSAMYYRLLSSTALGEPFLLLADEPAANATPGKAESDEMQFLLGFFKNNAAQFAPRWIRLLEGSLAPDELRRLAEALAGVGQYQESMRLVSLYAGKNGYQTTLKDMELWYPRPFPELVAKYGSETGIDMALLFALIRTESAFNSNIVSRAGAVGLTQLMPATAEEMAARIRRQGGPDYADSGLDLQDPTANIHIGAVYLAYLNDRMGDPLLALLSYNGGMNRVRRWLTTTSRYAGGNAPIHLPPDLFLETVEFTETRNYGRSVMAAAAIYRELYNK